jgi:8-oxo-dGTP diphosphatase
MTNITKVGIGVMLFRGDNVLLGKRKGSHGAGEWGLPGGGLEYMESFADCAKRELAEEVGPQVIFKELATFSVLNLIEYAPKHYVDIGMSAEWVSGEPKVMEPEKCEEWRWVNVFELPSPRFATIDRLMEAYLYRGPAFMDAEKGSPIS